jgi:hypothetical protein
VELLRDGEVLAEVGPPYRYTWETAGEAEGRYRLKARVVLGEVAFESEEREVVVDRTPPRVVSRTPEVGAEGVWVRSPIRAEFSEPLRAGTVTAESVRLTVGTVEVARTVSLSGDGRTLTVEPGAGYVPSSTVSLTFGAGVTDEAGNHVAASGVPWTWKLPYWIPWGSADGAPTANDYDRITSYAFDSSGTLVAIWRELAGSDYFLYVKRWEGGEWRIYSHVLAVDSPSSPIHTESLLLDGSGHPVVAWSKSADPSTSHIYVKRWTGNAWENLGGNPGGTSGLPQKRYMSLQWAPSGQPAIVWSELGGTQTRICTSQWDTLEWLPIGECFDALSTTDLDTNPTLRFSRDNTPIVSWVSSQTSGFAIQASQHIDSEWVLLEGYRRTDVQGPYVSMELDSTARPMTAWLSPNGNGYSLIVDRWSGAEWRPMGQPLSPPSTSAEGHSMQLDASGVPLIAWTDSRIHVHRWDGEKWQPLDDFSNSEVFGSTGASSLYRTHSGEIVLTWFRDMGSDTRIRVRRLNQ